MTIFIYAVICVSLSVAAQFLLKAGMSSVSIKAALAQPLGIGTILPVFTNSLVISGFALYGLGAVAWLGVLPKWDVSKATAPSLCRAARGRRYTPSTIRP